jgi:hypothetical protein
MFDEMVSWYPPLKITEDGEARTGDVPSNVEQESQLIGGPQFMGPIALHGKED